MSFICAAELPNAFSVTPAPPGNIRLPRESQSRQDNSLLRLVLPFFVFVRDFAFFVRLEKNHLAQSFVRVDSRRERRRVADFERDEAFPLRLEWSDVHNNSAARIRRFSDAQRQHISRDSEIFHRAS